MTTHGEKTKQLAAVLTAEKIDQISGMLHLFLNELLDEQYVLEEELRGSDLRAYRNAKVVLAALNLSESLRQELDRIIEGKKEISTDDVLRIDGILSLIVELAHMHIAKEAEIAYLSIPEALNKHKQQALGLLKAAHRFIGYLDAVRFELQDVTLVSMFLLPEDLKKIYDDFVNRILSATDVEDIK